MGSLKEWVKRLGPQMSFGHIEPTEPWPRAPDPVDSREAEWFKQHTYVPYAEIWCYWRIDRDGKPKPSFCDDPMGHPHVHLIRIPVPEDVQRCIAAVKDPPMCMVMNKFSKPEGACPNQKSEPTDAP